MAWDGKGVLGGVHVWGEVGGRGGGLFEVGFCGEGVELGERSVGERSVKKVGEWQGWESGG